ncbi:MAG TPA: hypothetical protein VKA08_12635 [Balneolales bacterium]|nr:hypothetical protein [Balneolales bacterium]
MCKKRITTVAAFVFLAVAELLTCSQVRAQNEHIDAFRNVGMGRGLALLHPADHSNDLPRLVRGSSVIALYDDYAIVNDRYTLSNDSGKDIVISCGLPRTGYFTTSLIDSVKFSSFSYLSATLNGKTVSFEEGKLADSLVVDDGCKGIKNWYISSLVLPPGTAELDVRSLVNTHDAQMINGHNIEHSHGFGYMLSTLNSWNSNTDFRVYILSKLIGNVPMQGIYPLHGFQTTGSKYVYDFKMTDEAVPYNVVIRYGHVSMYSPDEKSNLQSISSDAGQLTEEVSKIDPWSINLGNYHPVFLDNFRPFPSATFSVGGTILAFALLFGTILFFIIRSGMGQLRQIRRENENSGREQ